MATVLSRMAASFPPPHSSHALRSSSPPNLQNTVAATKKKITFTSPSLNAELTEAIKRAKAGSLASQAGLGDPQPIGYYSLEVYERLVSNVSGCYKLSWGIDTSAECDVRQVGAAVLGLVVYWGDPSPLHDQLASEFQSFVREAHRHGSMGIAAKGGVQDLKIPS